jgi:DNA-binding SARP family transcriptional activator
LDGFLAAAERALELSLARNAFGDRDLFSGSAGDDEGDGLESSLFRAHRLLNGILLDKAHLDDPLKFGESVLTLMKAHSALGETSLMEESFHAIPKHLGSWGEMDRVISEAAKTLTLSYLETGKLTKASQAFKGAFPEPKTIDLALERIKVAVSLMRSHLERNEAVPAAEIFFHFVPGGGSLALRPALPKSGPDAGDEKEKLDEYHNWLGVAAEALFDRHGKARDHRGMELLLESLEKLGGRDSVMRLRVRCVAALLKLAVDAGRLPDAMRFYGVLTSLAHMEEAMGLIPEAVSILKEAYRDAGDLEAVSRLARAGL